MDREAWRAAIHGVAKSWTWLSDWSDLIWLIFCVVIISFMYRKHFYALRFFCFLCCFKGCFFFLSLHPSFLPFFFMLFLLQLFIRYTIVFNTSNYLYIKMKQNETSETYISLITGREKNLLLINHYVRWRNGFLLLSFCYITPVCVTISQ